MFPSRNGRTSCPISSDVIGPVLHVIQSVTKDCQLLNGLIRLALDFSGITTGSVTVTERVFRNAGSLEIAVAVTGMSRSLVMPGKANGGLKAEEQLAGAAVRSQSCLLSLGIVAGRFSSR